MYNLYFNSNKNFIKYYIKNGIINYNNFQGGASNNIELINNLVDKLWNKFLSKKFNMEIELEKISNSLYFKQVKEKLNDKRRFDLCEGVSAEKIYSTITEKYKNTDNKYTSQIYIVTFASTKCNQTYMIAIIMINFKQ